MRGVILGVTIIFSSLAYGQPCFQSSELEIVRILRQGLQQKDLWEGFSLEAIPVVIRTDDSTKIILLNIDREVLKQNKISYESCVDDLLAVSIEITADFPAIPNEVYEFVFPEKATHPVISNLATILNHPIAVISIAASNRSRFSANDFAIILIHEAFHMAHQFWGGFELTETEKHPRDFFETCKLSAAWLQNLQTEQGLLKRIREHWAKYSVEELIEEAKAVTSGRSKFIQANPQDECYSHLNFWERIEGTAHYVDLITGLNLGAYSSFPASDTKFDDPQSFFYSTGGTYSLLLLKLFPHENWQSRINSGDGPFQVLYQLL